jgi:DNA-binding XRE family transcriptional regulator
MTMQIADPVVTDEGINIKAIRQELGITQAELAQLVGFSLRAIQSCEQGWRHPGPALEKLVLLLLMAHRNGGSTPTFRCWEVNECDVEHCRQCITFRTGQGHLCWFLSGTLCGGNAEHDWEQKRPTCIKCKLFRMLLAENNGD